MSFIWPAFLWFLLLVPILVVLYLFAQRRRQKYAVKFANLALIRKAAGNGPGFRRHIPAILTFAALAMLCLGLARPTALVPLLSGNGLVVLALDISGSMRARDIDPSRIEAAQAAARAFVKKQPAGSRLALVTFAASANLVQAPTDQKESILAAIDRISLQRGTAIGSGMVMAMNTVLEDRGEAPLPIQLGQFDQFNQDTPPAPPPPAAGDTPPLDSAVVILLTDGQSNVGPDPLDIAPLAAERQLRVYTVGLGDPNGVILQAEGRRARVVLDEKTLQAIADKTKADYYRAGSDTDLRKIYDKLGSTLVFKQEKTELTVFLAALAVLLISASGALSLFWFNRLP